MAIGLTAKNVGIAAVIGAALGALASMLMPKPKPPAFDAAKAKGVTATSAGDAKVGIAVGDSIVVTPEAGGAWDGGEVKSAEPKIVAPGGGSGFIALEKGSAIIGGMVNGKPLSVVVTVA